MAADEGVSERSPAQIALDDLRVLNARWASFAVGIVAGLQPSAAYHAAGFEAAPGKGRANNAYDLARRPEVATVIALLKEEASERAGVTIERIVEELGAVGFSDVRHYQLGPTGEIELAPGAPDRAMRAVATIKYITRPDGTRTAELRLHPKVPALELLGKHKEMFAPKDDDPAKAMGRDEALNKVLGILATAFERMGQATPQAPAAKKPAAKPAKRKR